jgi:DNA-binding winged helix-turn-helix (wHTH) protein
MGALWPNTLVEEANLSFQISTLRKAVGDREPPWIETVPKHGYRFSADVIVLPWGDPESATAASAVPGRQRGSHLMRPLCNDRTGSCE